MPRLNESLIDDEEMIACGDSRQTLRALATAGAQVRESIRLAERAGVAQVAGGVRPRSVLVATLGGSSVLADVLEMLAEPGSPVPVTTRHNLPLPGWVGTLDLVIAVSHSGRAPGPLALAAEATRRGAGLLTVGAPDSPLADVCRRARGIHVDVPAGGTSTRTSLWSLLTPALRAADGLGLVSCPESVLARVADRLDESAMTHRPGSASYDNPAKTLAADLAEGVPVVLGDGPVCGVAARRAALMLARTARVPATWGELPDAASQVVALLDGPYTEAGQRSQAEREGREEPPADIFRDPYVDGVADPRMALLVLRDAPEVTGASHPGPTDDGDDRAVGTSLADVVVRTAREAGVRVSEHTARPGHPVERLADLLSLTDFAATYLALGLGLDPAISPHLADLRDHHRQ
ncbi:MAG: phosphosugar isomerase [Actinomycetales bacterium]|nr:MAG: phosphosugar isomerase [Actinomycetales bacterium]